MKKVIVNSANAKYSSKTYLEDPENVEFLLKEEENDLSKFKSKDYKFHLNVLPHPYFGNIENPKILFLAKNPVYADYYEDEVDTYLYLKNHDDLTDYDQNLRKVNFFKNWNDGENPSFYSSWKWWNKKIIRNVKAKPDIINEIGFINLCGYQSKSFTKNHFYSFGCITEEKIKELIKNAKVIIVVWGKVLEDIPEIESIISDKEAYIVLNKEKTGANVNSLYKILNGECTCYGEKHEKKAIEILNNYLEK